MSSKDEKDVSFSPFAHHHTVRAKLNGMIEDGEITEEKAEKIYSDWRQKARKRTR